MSKSWALLTCGTERNSPNSQVDTKSPFLARGEEDPQAGLQESDYFFL